MLPFLTSQYLQLGPISRSPLKFFGTISSEHFSVKGLLLAGRATWHVWAEIGLNIRADIQTGRSTVPQCGHRCWTSVTRINSNEFMAPLYKKAKGLCMVYKVRLLIQLLLKHSYKQVITVALQFTFWQVHYLAGSQKLLVALLTCYYRILPNIELALIYNNSYNLFITAC